jgi:malate synthase
MAIITDNKNIERKHELIRKEASEGLTDEEKQEFLTITSEIKKDLENQMANLQEKGSEHQRQAENMKSGEKISKNKLYKELINDYRDAMRLAKSFSELKKELRGNKDEA